MTRELKDHELMNKKHAIIIIGSLILFFYVLFTYERDSGEMEMPYRGESIKLSKRYRDYHDYKNDPNNILPSEISKIERLLTEAEIPPVLKNQELLMREVFGIVFPGYGLSMLGEREQDDGSVLAAFLIEIPQVDKDRVLVFKKQNEAYILIDDFVHSVSSGFIREVVCEGDKLVYKSRDGTIVCTREVQGIREGGIVLKGN